ncbi:MAG: helix-turn-helix transcriptional regulator [Clostridia bacterium]|nr:helix-turn-helix transcriptional regulator [Clostridia bacterium]
MSIEMIGKQIAQLRKEKGVRQETLAAYVGVSTQAVSKWENGGLPDAGLLPKIADFFSVSIDFLFGRNVTDYRDLQSALIDKVNDTPIERRFRQVFNYCWDMERALMDDRHLIERNSIEDYEKEIDANAQHYSSILTDFGFTRMGVANRLQYFLIVPEMKDTEAAFFNGIDYPAFFRDFSDADVFRACVFLHKRESKHAFTPRLLVKHMGVTLEKSDEILKTLSKYRLIDSTQIEMDDETQTVYRFNPSPSFVALLIFAREVIDTPSIFCYHTQQRKKPYLG